MCSCMGKCGQVPSLTIILVSGLRHQVSAPHKPALCSNEKQRLFYFPFLYQFFLDSPYKQYYTIFVFLCLTYFTLYDHLHLYCCKWHYFILFDD